MAMARFGSQLVHWTDAKAQKVDVYKFYAIDDRIKKFLLTRPDRSFPELGIESLHATARKLQQRFADGAVVETTVGVGHADLHGGNVMLDVFGYVWSLAQTKVSQYGESPFGTSNMLVHCPQAPYREKRGSPYPEALCPSAELPGAGSYSDATSVLGVKHRGGGARRVGG